MNFNFLILILILLLVAIIIQNQIIPKNPPIGIQDIRNKQETKKKKKKQVRFNPIVTIQSAGGCKKDRYNPQLRQIMTQNTLDAAKVGGMKELARLSLT